MMQGRRYSGQCGGMGKVMTVSFFPRDLGLLLSFPVAEVTVVLPSLGGLSQGRLCAGILKSWTQA